MVHGARGVYCGVAGIGLSCLLVWKAVAYGLIGKALAYALMRKAVLLVLLGKAVAYRSWLGKPQPCPPAGSSTCGSVSLLVGKVVYLSDQIAPLTVELPLGLESRVGRLGIGKGMALASS